MKRNGNPTYKSWYDMIRRCHNPKADRWEYYGGRGIEVCQRWRDSLDDFIEDVGEKPKGMTLDRIDNNGNYQQDNVRWISHQENCRNRRSNIDITIKGETKTLIEWAEEYGMKYTIARKRITMLGWEPLEALTKPPKKWRQC